MSASLASVRQFDTALPDGRTLHAYEAGDPTGRLVVYHHGTPMSGLLKRDWAEDAAQRGLRLIGFDRAGYAGSTRDQGRAIADVTRDVTVLADSVGADRFFTWGISGGGPHALACAALLGDRVIAAASLASVGPYDGAGLSFLDGMGQDNLDEFEAAAEGPGALGEYLAGQRGGLLASTPQDLRDAMASLLPDVDRNALTGETAEFLHSAMTSGLRHHADGWADDDLAFVSPWGFDVGSIAVPLLITQGDQDLMVPFAHGTWLAAHAPAAEVRLLPGEGHISLMAKVGDVHAWLTAHE